MMGVQEHHVSCFHMFSNILLLPACLLLDSGPESDGSDTG